MAFASAQKSSTQALDALAAGYNNYYSKTTGAETLSTTQFINGFVSQDGAQAAFNLTTPTAAAIVAAIPGVAKGNSFKFAVSNPTGGADITVVGGSGVTIKGTATAATAGALVAVFEGIVTNVTASSEAVLLVRLS